MSERCYACGQPNRDDLIKRLKEQNADLLEACKAAKIELNARCNSLHDMKTIEQLSAAIAKAEGASQ